MTSILIKIAAVLALLAAVFFGIQYIRHLGAAEQLAVDTAQIEHSKREVAATLATETAKTRAAEQALQAKTNQQEIQDAGHQKTVADLSDRLRRAAGPAGRLRDPHAAGCRASGGSTQSATASAPGDRSADPAETGGLLSAAATDFLLKLSREADDINAAFASCRADAYTVRGQPEP